MKRRPYFIFSVAVLAGAVRAAAATAVPAPAAPAAPIAPADMAFFEAKVRPVLVERCYKCHSHDADRVKGGLMLDTHEGMMQWRRHRPTAIELGKPQDSPPRRRDRLWRTRISRCRRRATGSTTTGRWPTSIECDPAGRARSADRRGQGQLARLRRRRPAALVLPAGDEAGRAARAGRGLVQEPDRQFRPGQARGQRDEAQPEGGQADPDRGEVTLDLVGLPPPQEGAGLR